MKRDRVRLTIHLKKYYTPKQRIISVCSPNIGLLFLREPDGLVVFALRAMKHAAPDKITPVPKQHTHKPVLIHSNHFSQVIFPDSFSLHTKDFDF